MEGNGLEAALECEYAQLIFGHMFRGKASARTVCRHMLHAPAILSLLLEDFLASLTKSQHAKLIEIYKLNQLITLMRT